MDDYKRTKKRLFSIFEKAKKRNNLNEASHSKVVCMPPDSADIDPYENLTISCDNVSGVAGNVELEIDDTEYVKDDDDLDDSFVSDSFLDTIDTNAIADMINTTGIFKEKESQVQIENTKKNENKSKENFKPQMDLETKMLNVSNKNEKDIESPTLHSLKTTGSFPVRKTLNKKYFSIFKQNEGIVSMTTTTTNTDNEQNTPKISGNGSESRKVNLSENEVGKAPARKRGRPPASKSAKVTVKKQPKTRIRKVNVAKTPKNTYGKLSEDKLSSVECRKIPQHILNEVLDMLQNEDHQVWQDRNISCNAGIHRYWETRTMVSDKNLKLKYARQFLLRREWLNLAKILCLFNREEKNNTYYPILVKYATLCLAHTDKEQFQEFVKSLTSITDSSAIIKKCTKISQQNCK